MHSLKQVLRALACSAVAASSLWGAQATWAQAAEGQAQDLPTIGLSAGMHNITAQVASSPRELAIGLMYRRDMPANHGMLFVFDKADRQCFWMKNTLMPLSIAFVADDGRIVNVDEMKAGTLNEHCSTEPVRYVLEMNAGWFKRKGIKPGQRLSGNPFKAR